MKTLKTLLFAVLLGTMSFSFTACGGEESCDACKINDPDEIVSEDGNQCNDDFVSRCKTAARLSSSVDCTCK